MTIGERKAAICEKVNYKNNDRTKVWASVMNGLKIHPYVGQSLGDLRRVIRKKYGVPFNLLSSVYSNLFLRIYDVTSNLIIACRQFSI